MHIKKIMVWLLTLMMFVNMAQGMNLTAKPGKCSVCFEEEGCYVSTCCPDDIMCLDCRKGAIADHLDKKEVPHCPARGCIQVIDQGAVQNILRNDRVLTNRYNTLLNENRMRENGLKPCYTPDCNGEFDNKLGQRTHQCDVCHQHYCTTCKFDHRGNTCVVAQKTPRKCAFCNATHAPKITCEVVKDDKELQEKNVQKCPGPGCDAMLEKTDGCNYMKCGHCRHEFCWLCLGPGRFHRCINNNCGIWNNDHRALAQQLANIEEQLANVGRGSYEYEQLERQKAALEGQRDTIEAQRVKSKEIEAQKIIMKNIIIATSVLGTAGAYIAYATVYQAWSQKRKFDLVMRTAEQTVEKILAIEFELFDESNCVLGLQEQFDIESLTKIIKSDAKRDAFKSAIAAYDLSLKAVHDAISSTKYYHQTPEFFAQHEPKLIQKLYADLESLKQALSSCRAEIGVNWKKLVGMSGLLAGAAVGAKWYYSDI